MDLLEEFLTGLIKPPRDLLISILIYLIIFAVTSFQSVTSNLSPTTWSVAEIFDPLKFLILFVMVSIFIEIFLGFKQGVYRPFNASAKIGGICLGTIVFLPFIETTYSIIGGSTFEVYISLGIMCVASITGFSVRFFISKENRFY